MIQDTGLNKVGAIRSMFSQEKPSLTNRCSIRRVHSWNPGSSCCRSWVCDEDADRADPSRHPRVAVADFGEGAASEGDFHGALNMAAMINRPIILIYRNNSYTILTPASEQYKGAGISSRVAG